VEMQGAQLVQFWPPGQVSDEQRTELVQEVQECITNGSHALGLKMIEYIYGEREEAPARRRGRKKKWSYWEI